MVCTVLWIVDRPLVTLDRRFCISGVASVRWRVVCSWAGAALRFCARPWGRKEKSELVVVGLVARAGSVSTSVVDASMDAALASGAAPSSVVCGSVVLVLDVGSGDVGADAVASLPISFCACCTTEPRSLRALASATVLYSYTLS